jgi:hypothetical protein
LAAIAEAQPVDFSPVYDGPYRVLERSTHFFLLEIGERTNKVSTLRLKAAQTPADMEPAKLLCRGRPVAQAVRCHLSAHCRRLSGGGLDR